MCFYTYTKPKLQKAKKDIKVYKIITKKGGGAFSSLKIDGKKCKWERGWHYTELDFVSKALFKSVYFNTWKVEGNAFHSKKTIEDSEAYFRRSIYNPKNKEIVEMIIPKNSWYYENETEYVSSDIIFP